MTDMTENLNSKTCSSESGGPIRGSMTVPGDKSISHRAVMLGSISEGMTTITGLLEGEDVLRTVAAFRSMGVEIVRNGSGAYRIQGVGLDGLAEPEDVLDLGNSGTGMRLLAGLLAAQPFFTVLTGDASLRTRPMDRIVTPLTTMGADVRGRDNNRYAPLAIQGGDLTPIDYRMPYASAQIKSSVLLAALNTPGTSRVTEPAPTRDHTEQMLTVFGADLRRDGSTIEIDGWPDLAGCSLQIPGDFSSAAFPMVAALSTPGSDLYIENIGINPTRTGLLDLLKAMGASMDLLNPREIGGEPVADLHVRYSELSAIDVPTEVVPRAIDEFPVFFVAASLAEGETVLRGASELRVKESDRLAVMVQGLKHLGVMVEEYPDGLRIVGKPEGFQGGVVLDSGADHRVAMSFLIAGLRCRKPVTVCRCETMDTSFPKFAQRMASVGMVI